MGDSVRRIEATENGPYGVFGRVDLVRVGVLSEGGHPIEWQEPAAVDTSGEADDEGTYWLCRCGRSGNKPFCDGSHKSGPQPFDGTEAAPTDSYEARARVMQGHGVQVRDDRGICEHAGFCMRADTNVWKMVRSDDADVVEQMVAMVDHCPSGALTHRTDGDRVDDEPDLPQRILIVDDGPLWVTGGVPVDRADGADLQTRNRMTLCRCGASKFKPLCDGSHAEVGFTDS